MIPKNKSGGNPEGSVRSEERFLWVESGRSGGDEGSAGVLTERDQ